MADDLAPQLPLGASTHFPEHLPRRQSQAVKRPAHVLRLATHQDARALGHHWRASSTSSTPASTCESKPRPRRHSLSTPAPAPATVPASLACPPQRPSASSSCHDGVRRTDTAQRAAAKDVELRDPRGETRCRAVALSRCPVDGAIVIGIRFRASRGPVQAAKQPSSPDLGPFPRIPDPYTVGRFHRRSGKIDRTIPPIESSRGRERSSSCAPFALDRRHHTGVCVPA